MSEYVWSLFDTRLENQQFRGRGKAILHAVFV